MPEAKKLKVTFSPLNLSLPTYVGGACRVARRLEYTFDPTRFGKTRKYSEAQSAIILLFSLRRIFLAVVNLSYPTCTPRCNASLIGTAISTRHSYLGFPALKTARVMNDLPTSSLGCSESANATLTASIVSCRAYQTRPWAARLTSAGPRYPFFSQTRSTSWWKAVTSHGVSASRILNGDIPRPTKAST
jgi:hypothetical protein